MTAPAPRPREALVVGGGVAGLAAACTLAQRGWQVRLIDAGTAPCSPQAGGMLAPCCELDHAEPGIVALGLDAVAGWQALLADPSSDALWASGSVLVAHRPEWPLLDQLADRVQRAGHGARLTALDHAGLKATEPLLGDKFRRGWLVGGEGVVHPRRALPALRQRLQALGGTVEQAEALSVSAHTVQLAGGVLKADVVVDARGLGARDALPLRGVRGEFAIVRTAEVSLSRPTRLMHPRYPLYVVPRPDGRFYLGATQLERDDDAPPTVRAGLELLSALYSVHPAFGDAEIEEMGVGLRPATPDHAPWLVHAPGLVRLNGLFRHGFLLAPRMATALADVLDGVSVGADAAPFVQEAA